MAIGLFMKFPNPLHEAILLKHKKTLAEVILADQQKHTIYCQNPGSLIGCHALGSRIWFSCQSNPHKGYPDTWELIEGKEGQLICVNHQRTKEMVLDSIAQNQIPSLTQYQHILSDVKFENQRFDFLLSQHPHFHDKEAFLEEGQYACCFGVINSVTLGDEIKRGFFPDVQNKKISKQLAALIKAKEMGYRAVLIYCVTHPGINRVFPADHIDPDFGSLLRQAVIRGVEIMAYRTEITLEEMHIVSPIEVRIPARMLYTPRAEKSG